MPHLEKILTDIDKDLDNALERLFAWLRIPSVSTDPAYKADCRRAAEWLKGDLAAMGFEASVRDTPGHPVVMAHLPKSGAPHVLFYGHYDVQPVDPLSLWETPPFEPRMATLQDGRKVISARGACDDKGQVMTFVEACRAFKAIGELPVGITMMFGGEARNPIHVLSKIVADLHDANGRIMVPGFYEGVGEMPPDVLERWRRLNLTPEDFLGQVGLRIPAGERDRMLIEQIQSRPTCDANGIIGGYTGEGTKTVIAGEARAKISFRLVGDQDPARVTEGFERFVRERIPEDCSVEIVRHKGSRAIQLPYDMPVLKKAEAALSQEWGTEAVTIGSGGSIPIVGDFKRTLGLDTLLVGFGLD